MPQLTPEQQKLYYASQGNATNPISPLDWLKTQEVPTNIKEETPTGTLPPLGDLGNLRVALRSALNEAAQNTQASRLQQMSGLIGGGASYSVLTAALGLARSGLQTSQETIFGDVMTGYTEEQKLKETKKASALNMMNTVIDNGVFADTPAGTLLAWETEAGLPEGTALAWQARLKIEQDKSDELGTLQLQKLKQDITDAGTPASLTDLTDTLFQEYYDAGLSPTDIVTKMVVRYQNLGVQPKKEQIDKWTVKANQLKKTPTPPIVPPAPLSAKEKGQKTATVAKEIGSTIKYLPSSFAENLKSDISAVGSFFSGLFGQ